MTDNWQCPKCKGTHYSTDTMAATGAGFSKIFDVQNKKFTSVTCDKCTYTEFYKTQPSTLGNVFDFFTS